MSRQDFDTNQEQPEEELIQKRVHHLHEARLGTQKKTYTRWMNSYLSKVGMEVDDLFVDLKDGRKLLKLLEILSGEKLGRPNIGKLRIHQLENVNISLRYLHTKMRLGSIGAEDIVDGNQTLILGLLYSIVLKFQITQIETEVDEEKDNSEKKSVKDALLLWVQLKTLDYPGVEIRDFSTSWRTGLAFNALIHAHRPDLFDYKSLTNNSNIDNLNHAFEVASKELGIPQLVDAEDIDTSKPDEKSIMTYISLFYDTFAKKQEKSGRGIVKV